MSGSAAENQLKAGMTSGKDLLGGNNLLGGENLLGRRKASPHKVSRQKHGLGLHLAGLRLAGLRGWLALPRDLALGRLAYHLKRPLFALPQAPWHWRGNPPATAALVPPDPWPGNAQRGAAILEDSYHFLGRSLNKPAPRWNPVGVERAWLEALHGFSWLRDLRAAGGDAARRKARALVGDWIEANAAWTPVAWHPVVTGSRLAQWFSQYEFYAASADVGFRQRLLTSAARQARHLAAVLPAGLSGAGLVTAAKGLCLAGLCLPDGGIWLNRGLALLGQALEAQILHDGGQRERCPALLLSVLRDCIDLRAALLAALAGSLGYEETLGAHLLDGLREVPGLTLYGPPTMEGRVPTFAFTLAGQRPGDVATALAEQGIFVWSGHFYAVETIARLGLAESGGLIRVGLCHYNSEEEIDALVEALHALARGR